MVNWLRSLSSKTRWLIALGAVILSVITFYAVGFTTKDATWVNAAPIQFLACQGALMIGVCFGAPMLFRGSGSYLWVLKTAVIISAVSFVAMFCVIDNTAGRTLLKMRRTQQVNIPPAFVLYNPLEYRPIVYPDYVLVFDADQEFTVRITTTRTARELHTSYGSPAAYEAFFKKVVMEATTSSESGSADSHVQHLCAIESQLKAVLPPYHVIEVKPGWKA